MYQHTPSASLITFGILTGVGIGLPYSPFYTEISIVKCFRNKNTFLTKLFPEHENLVAGLIFGGFALGALPFTFFQKFLLNPDNLPINR